MYQLLEKGALVYSETTKLPCKILELLGAGGQGEVYKVQAKNQQYALKWYFPEFATSEQHQVLENLVAMGPPDSRFLWPIELVHESKIPGFGYLMPVRDLHFRSPADLMKRRIEVSPRVLCTIGYNLVDCYHKLHAKGLCYRDISFGNCFFDPQMGDVLICDNDNVTVDKQKINGPLGTPKFMAPEIVRREANPSTQTDLFSLSVLLFYLFVRHHPLEGQAEAQIHCLDLKAMNHLYGEAPVFIYDPQDTSNRPLQGYHDNALVIWPIYPKFFRDLFTKAFTIGLNNPDDRVREPEWRQALVRLRDLAFYCASCGAENFYDVEKLRLSGGQVGNCWHCGKQLNFPPRLRIDNQQIVMLNLDTHLYPYHLDKFHPHDFRKPLARINQHPQYPSVLGLRNLGQEKWTITNPDGTSSVVANGQSATIKSGLKINFGSTTGEVRV